MKHSGERIVIWGTGIIGSSKLLVDLLKTEYEIIAYCDSDKAKWGKCVNGYWVKSFEEIEELNREGAFDLILIAVYNPETAASIRKTIEMELTIEKPIEMCEYSSIRDKIENTYIAETQKTLDFSKYKIDYIGQAEIWLENLMSEVVFWINQVARENAGGRKGYCKRLYNKDFESDLSTNTAFVSDYLCNATTPLVYDIGCGLAPRFGEYLQNGNRISLVEVDPLAYFYNYINKKFAPTEYKEIVFGMFEYLSKFFTKGSADAVIINNALDHCIDPFKSILESLMILKTGGILHLNHGRAEGINGKYMGLHQWNLDYTEQDEFIIWNYHAAVNVSESLRDIASIQVYHSTENTSRDDQYVCVEIIKKKDFRMEQYVDVKYEMENMAYIIDKLMEMISNPEINKVFERMLME